MRSCCGVPAASRVPMSVGAVPPTNWYLRSYCVSLPLAERVTSMCAASDAYAVTDPHESVATSVGCGTYSASPGRMTALKPATGAPAISRTHTYVPRAAPPASQPKRPTDTPVGDTSSQMFGPEPWPLVTEFTTRMPQPTTVPIGRPVVPGGVVSATAVALAVDTAMLAVDVGEGADPEAGGSCALAT